MWLTRIIHTLIYRGAVTADRDVCFITGHLNKLTIERVMFVTQKLAQYAYMYFYVSLFINVYTIFNEVFCNSLNQLLRNISIFRFNHD